MENNRSKYDNDVFISYSSKQARGAYLVRDVLTRNGLSCWMAPESIPKGSDYTNEIPPAIAGCKVVVLILTADSQHSDFVCSEIKRAIDNSKVIIPFMLTNCKIDQTFDFMISRYQRIQAFKGLSDALEELVDSVYRIIDKQNPSIDRDYLKQRLRLYRRKRTVTVTAAFIVCAVLFAVLSVVFGQIITEWRESADVTKGTVGECVWLYDSKSATLTVSGEGSMDETNASYTSTVPWQDYIKEIKTFKVDPGVTSICPYAVSEAVSLETAELPDTLVRIGASAFRSCTAMKTITFPDGLKTIDTCAFYGCTGMRELTIPASVTEIGKEAFLGSGLASVSVSGNNTAYSSVDGCLYNKKKTRLLFYPPHKTDRSFEVPDQVTDIETCTFSGCTDLNTVVLPDTVETIGDKAFSGCSNLTEISLSANLITLGNQVFYLCSSLRSVALPDSVKNIGKGTFDSCTSLTGLQLCAGTAGIPSKMFRFCISLEEAEIPSGLVYIEDEAFANCSKLKRITIPESVTRIDETAFSDCPDLIIAGKPGSFAESYAAEAGYDFEAS